MIMAAYTMALVVALLVCAAAMVDASADATDQLTLDAAVTLSGLVEGLVGAGRVLLGFAMGVLVIGLVSSFVGRKQSPAARSLIESLDHVRVAVDRITAAGAEVSDIETLRAKIAAERADLDALRETTAEQRRAVLAQSGTKKWTVISICVGLAGSAALALAMDSLLDRL